MSLKSAIKSLLVGGSKTSVRAIRFGAGSGIKMMIDPNHRTQRVLGLDEYELLNTFKKFSKLAGIYIDLGSSDGYYPLIYRKWNPSGDIYSFEVQDHLVAEQPKNFLLNGFTTDKLSVIQKYASDKNDSTHASIDTTVNTTGKTVFLKIDIEGAELDALKGAANLLAKNKCYLIVETHSKSLEEECIKLLNNAGYTTKIVGAAWFRGLIPEKRVIEHNRWLVAQK